MRQWKEIQTLLLRPAMKPSTRSVCRCKMPWVRYRGSVSFNQIPDHAHDLHSGVLTTPQKTVRVRAINTLVGRHPVGDTPLWIDEVSLDTSSPVGL
jgi:hypothetical protein